MWTIIAWVVVGGIAGWIASKIMGTDASMGIPANVIVGIIGGLITAGFGAAGCAVAGLGSAGLGAADGGAAGVGSSGFAAAG